MKRWQYRRQHTPRFKIYLLVFSTFCLVFGFTLTYYHSRFSLLIDAKLGLQPSQETAIYSRPYRVWVGQKIPLCDLKKRLEHLGYARHQGGGAGNGYRVVDNRRIRVSHQAAKSRPRKFEIVLTGSGRQTRVTSLREGTKGLNQFLLKPQFLSNLFGKSREKQKHIHFKALPKCLVHAILAAEDERFFTHPGVDWLSSLRAAFVNLVHFGRVQGGSTLTQQFVKNYFLSPKKSFKRKLKEIFLALLLENRFSKQEIFEAYANEVYLGQIGSFAVVGLGQGAAIYFGKNVESLDLAESAFLAGIIQAPNRYSPHRSGKAALLRRNHILDLMVDKNFISGLENAEARKKSLQVVPPTQIDYAQAPYFVDYVREGLRKEWLDSAADSGDSLVVYTTLHIDLQGAAFRAIQTGLAEIDALLSDQSPGDSPQVSLIAVDPRTGEILALVGGRNYGLSQYNRVTKAFRQPGSTFKPFVYAAAQQTNLHPSITYFHTLSTLLLDEPYTFQFEKKGYRPRNFGDKYHGLVSLRESLALSLNVPTVKLAERIGFSAVATLCQKVGFDRVSQPYPSLALGAFETTLLELAQAYTVFANEGSLAPFYATTAIEKNGLKEERSVPKSHPVLDSTVAFLITSALQSTLEEGTGKSIRARGFQLPSAGKTGTSADSWFVGYTPDLLCAVWVGYDDGRSLDLSGARAALPIWTSFMLRAKEIGYLSGRSFPEPPGIVHAQIDTRSGLMATRHCREVRTEYYLSGTEPARLCYTHRM